ncbi:MAG: ACT domain-containing protein [Gudongella sp.]|jgi:uncharacterized protein with ACT and thioredoxin-like domain|nr:ACT domain-containing protein [Gudongella sp.]
MVKSNESELNQNEVLEEASLFKLQFIDQKGVISKISAILASKDINIATMQVTRNGNISTLMCHIDGVIDKEIMNQITSVHDFKSIEFIK